MTRTLYPSLIQPVLTAAQEPEQITESRWHQPWSEPVKQKIRPALAIALVASGLFSPVLTPTQISNGFEASYHQPWSEPVRAKRAVGAQLQQPSAFVPVVVSAVAPTWFFSPFSEPQRPKSIRLTQLQRAYEASYLPPPQAAITAVMSAFEINLDVALFGINVYNSVPTPYILIAGANVGVEEIPAIDGGAASIEET